MAGAKTKKLGRKERRERERAAEKIVRAKEKLARMEEGGAPERPIVLESASQVETHARSTTCARCDVPHHVDDHTAETAGDVRLRVAHVRCAMCGSRRAIYYRLAPPLPN
jgi:hypothetical protein